MTAFARSRKMVIIPSDSSIIEIISVLTANQELEDFQYLRNRVCMISGRTHSRFSVDTVCTKFFWLHGRTPRVYMQTTPNTRSLSRLAKAAVALEVFLSVGALGGGGALMLGSRGEIIPLPLSALKVSPFQTYFVPGLILFLVLGLGPLAAAQLAWRRHSLAPIAALGVGVALLIWMTVEIAFVGYTNSPPLQPFYLLLGAVITSVGLGWLITLRP
jgi:hypothetical protein